MNTKNMIQEQISAFSDGELTECQMEVLLTALRQRDSRETWDAYHHIGDVLRSDEMAFAMSPNFTARMAAHMAAEPTIVAPRRVNQAQMQQRQIASPDASASTRLIRRLGFSGVAAAAVAVVALVTAPQLMVALKGSSASESAPVMVASAPKTPGAVSAHASQTAVVAAVNAQDGGVLRDPRIDDYLLAHQRFSPSVFSTAQYARTATFSTDSNK